MDTLFEKIPSIYNPRSVVNCMRFWENWKLLEPDRNI